SNRLSSTLKCATPPGEGRRFSAWAYWRGPRVEKVDTVAPERKPRKSELHMSTHNPQTKKKTKGRKSNATKLAHKKFRFIEHVIADPSLCPLATRAAIFVGCKCSLDHGGQAIIGQDKIAEKLGAWRQDVSQALRQAVALGHLQLIRRGRDHANAYRMVLKDE